MNDIQEALDAIRKAQTNPAGRHWLDVAESFLKRALSSPHPEARKEDVEAILYALYQSGLRQGKWLVQNTGPNSPVPMQPSMDIPIYEAMDALSRLAAPKPEGQATEALRVAGLLKQIEQMSAPSDMTPHGMEEALKFIHGWAGEALCTPAAPEPRPAEDDAIQASEVKKAMEYNGRAICDWKGARDTLAAEVRSLRSQLARKDEGMRGIMRVMRHLAEQRLRSEVPEEEREYADYEGAYDCIIREVRAALREPDGRKGE